MACTEHAPEGLPIVEIYTDGACSPNPGPGGWSAILIFGEVCKEYDQQPVSSS